MPITAARRMYSPTTVRPIPSDRAITRALAPQAYLKRRTSRTFRIDNLSAGIGPSPCSNRKGMTLRRSDCRQRSPPHPINRGGRLRSESVAALPRIGWPLSVGISGRLASDSALSRPFQQVCNSLRALSELGSPQLPPLLQPPQDQEESNR